jgi:hypothetical protein
MLDLVLVALLSVPPQHPCDAILPTTAVKGSQVGFCHEMKDVDGLAIPASALGFRVVLNTGATYDIGIISAQGAASSSGYFYFLGPLPSGLPRGVYIVAIQSYEVGGGASANSTDTAQWQVGGPPTKPVKPRILGGGGGQ